MARDTGQPNTNVPHKGCNSSSCCSPAKLWRTLQLIIKNDNKKELIKFFKDDRLEHIVRVALTSRVSNDAALYPPSQQHKVIRLTSRESMLYLGKSFVDLNSLQFALLVSSESMVVTLLNQLKLHASAAELKHYVNHIWGQGNSSLHLASFLKRSQVVKLLLELGCSFEVANRRNKQAIDCCLGDAAVLEVFTTMREKATAPPVVSSTEMSVQRNDGTPPIAPTPDLPEPTLAKESSMKTDSTDATSTATDTAETVPEQTEAILPGGDPIDFVEQLQLNEMKPTLIQLATCYQWLLCFNQSLLACAQNQIRLDPIVQPNQCIPLIQLKKPPDIMAIQC